MASTRRLAAILAADVVGYSRLMRADEEGTHERLKAHRRELVDPKITEHHGRIVKYTGDGMLAEFASVVEAVLCAVEVQRGMSHRNLDVADDERISFRIGINLGDVIVEPRRHLRRRCQYRGAARSAGRAGRDLHLRDRVRADPRQAGVPVRRSGSSRASRTSRGRCMSLRCAPRSSPLCRLRSRAWLPLQRGDRSIAARRRATAPVDRRAAIYQSERRPEQQYLADGITDDVTTDLSRIADMIVISRNTAFTYRDKPIDTRQIGRELNVRYVLEGSVRRAGNRVRVNTQLIDAETDAHLWAERFDYAADDLFALQDEVTSRIAVALNLELVGAEAARPTEHPDALDYILRGRAARNRGSTPENFSEAIELFEKALKLDPTSVDARGSF